jgi:hypothetical protein
VLAKDLSDFWGRRWNTWVRDFFFTSLFQPMRRHPVSALLAIFFFSGVLHEAIIDVPFWCFSGRNLLGYQVLYFMIQSLGMLVDHQLSDRVARRLLLWLVVLGPVPLMLNEAALGILQLQLR